MTTEREALVAELDEILGPPDGSELNLTPAQQARVREIQERLRQTGETLG
jgi:hypothetical protein